MRLAKARARPAARRRVARMSTTYVSAELRRLVMARAEGAFASTALIAEDDTFLRFCAVDHIISEKARRPDPGR